MRASSRPARTVAGNSLTLGVPSIPSRTGLAFAAAVTHVHNATRSDREEACHCGSCEVYTDFTTERIGGRGPVLHEAVFCKCGFLKRLVGEATDAQKLGYYSRRCAALSGEQIAEAVARRDAAGVRAVRDIAAGLIAAEQQAGEAVRHAA